MIQKHCRFQFTFLLMLACSGLLQAQAPNTTDLTLQTSGMNHLMINYYADQGAISRFYSTSGNSYGGGRGGRQMGNDYNSPERRARLMQLNNDYLKQLQQINFDRLDINSQVDFILFKRNVDDNQYQLEAEKKIYDQISNYFPFSDKIYALEKPRRRGEVVKGEEVAKALNEIGKEISKAIAAVKKEGTMDKPLAEMASSAAGGLQGALKNLFDFYNGYDPMFTWWVPANYTEVDSLLNVYAGLLKSKGKTESAQKDDGSGIVGNPIGAAELIRQLQLEFIPYTPEELIAIANKEFAYCDAELLKAAKAMGFGNDWQSAQEKVKNAYVEPGSQPQAMYDLYKHSVDFLKKNNLVSFPALSEEIWRMNMMSPERQLVNPFFTGGEVLSISYPTNTMTYDQKMMSMRGNNPHFSRATVHHELIAGHHLQGFMTSRYKTYRRFSTPFWVEGLALYWEMLLWDMDFPRSPEDRIGMLFWRMHRCARIIFSLNYHLGQWTPQQCIDFLVDRVGFERANAEGEVRRSFATSYSPLYQLAYMIGGLQIMSMKRELVDTKKMSYRDFHDAIYRENGMPIEMLRAILTNQTLKKDFKTNWKFYGNAGK